MTCREPQNIAGRGRAPATEFRLEAAECRLLAIARGLRLDVVEGVRGACESNVVERLPHCPRQHHCIVAYYEKLVEYSATPTIAAITIGCRAQSASAGVRCRGWTGRSQL